jgi:hypothetical protein
MARIDIGQNIMKPKVVPATAEGFFQAADDRKTGRICADLADMLEQKLRGEMTEDEYKEAKGKLKRGCRFYTPHAHFNKGYKRSDGDPVDSGKAVIDMDGCADFAQRYEQHLKGREKELGINMVNISVSSTGGHVLFDIPEGLSREEAQQWMAHLMGDAAYDKAVHEAERAIYIPCREYILYIDEALMFGDELHPAEVNDEGRKTKNEGRKTKNEENCQLSPFAKQMGPSAAKAILNYQLEFKGIPYSSIISEFLHRTGGEPKEGERNKRLHQLAANLRAVCDNSEAWLLELMPRYGLSEEEMRSIIHSACKEPTKGSRLMDQIVSELGEKDEVQESLESNVPPAMPEKLPKLIQLLTSNTPAEYRAAVSHAVFPALATHLCGVHFRYTDNVEHEATLMNCLMAGTGAGKGCIDEPIRHIMADIRRRDKENEEREKEWKKENNKRGDNKDKMLRPEGLVIQIIDSDMTKPALVTRMDEAEGHFVYVKLNEIDLFEQLKGQTGKQHFQLMCLAFDPGAEYGQTRVGTQSVTARPVCRFNWNACTTILKGRRFFSRVLTDGPISRINFCTIPEQEIGGEQPIYGCYDLEFDEALKPYIDNLVGARGLTDCPQAYRLARKLQDECAEFARLSQNEVYWNLSHRACVIAWLKACVLYVANGCKWERCIEDFVRWSLNYDLWCKMRFFGEDIEKANSGSELTGRRGPKNLLELLPDEFTLEDAKRVRRQQGLTIAEKDTLRMIRIWKCRGYVFQISDFSFKKSGIYANGKGGER